MTFKDKPKRPGAKPFERETKPKAADAVEKPRKRMAGIPVKSTQSATDGAAGKPERISKIMARAGVASRRDVERIIMEGRVKLNGVTLESPAINATLSDRIEVDGQPIRGIERTRLWLYHKPAGLVTTNSDPEGRPTVFDNLPEGLPRVLSIGRLDINTEGLLLLTNDGGLARVLELPTTGWLRRYRVRAHGSVDQEALDKLKDGIAVDGVLYGSIEATLDKVQGSNVWITMGLREGKNREIKNVMGALGLEVNRLIRISYGPFQLGELPERQVMEVRGRTLRDQLGPRLIEDAHANFDAPIYDANAIDSENPDADAVATKPKPERNGGWEKAGDKRERVLSRLDTKRDDRKSGDSRGGDRFAKPERGSARPGEEERAPRRAPAQGRKANVWMAPGARPVAEKTAKSDEAGEKRSPRPRPEGAPAVKRYGRTKEGVANKSAKKFDPDRKSARGGFDRPDTGPRVTVNRTSDDEGTWIRADSPPTPEKSFGDKPRGDRSFGDRKPRPEGDRDRPRAERSFGDKPRGDKPFGDRKPRTEGDRPRAKPFSGDARSERPRSERPAGDRPFGDRPRSDKPRGDKPFGDKPFGDKPRGAKPGGGKSFGGKPAGGKPSGSKPYTGRPSSDRPDGDKPSGGPRGGRPGGGAAGVKRGADRRR